MKERQLRIWRSYEPNRLATNYLSDTYGKLIMSTKYHINGTAPHLLDQ